MPAVRRRDRFLRRAVLDPPRPYVAFAATDARHARRLYRAQNLIWVWLGIAAMLSGLAYVLRPDLGPVLVTHSPAIDGLREVLFAVGGLGITTGVWWIRREIEVVGHVLFASGALITAVAMTTLPGKQGIGIATTLGLSVASAFRTYYIARWIGSGDVPRS